MNKIALVCVTLFTGAMCTSIKSTVSGLSSSFNGNGVSSGIGESHREAKIDWCGEYDDDQCYCNKIDIQGPKILLVNLDDHCLLDDIED